MWERAPIQWSEPNLMNGRGIKDLEVKIFEFENTRSNVKKMLRSLRKNKTYVIQIIHTNHGHLPTKGRPDIDFSDAPVVQYDVPVVENTFVDDCK